MGRFFFLTCEQRADVSTVNKHIALGTSRIGDYNDLDQKVLSVLCILLLSGISRASIFSNKWSRWWIQKCALTAANATWLVMTLVIRYLSRVHNQQYLQIITTINRPSNSILRLTYRPLHWMHSVFECLPDSWMYHNGWAKDSLHS